MYAKTLVPGLNPISALIATTDKPDVLMPQLLSRGWAPFGDPVPSAAAGRVLIGTDRLRLRVDGQDILEDQNPAGPDGWWAAVDQYRDKCLVVIVRTGDVDLADEDAGQQLAALAGAGGAVYAALPLATILDG